MDRYLLWDVARCNGDGCARRETCMRHDQLKNMGPRTPVMSHCLVDEPGGYVTWPNYIPLDGVRPSNALGNRRAAFGASGLTDELDVSMAKR